MQPADPHLPQHGVPSDALGFPVHLSASRMIHDYETPSSMRSLPVRPRSTSPRDGTPSRALARPLDVRSLLSDALVAVA
jgi:hypothetical protein